MHAHFHILTTSDDQHYLSFIRDLIFKYYQKNYTVLVYGGLALCQKLDHLLWFHGKDTFIPHAILHDHDKKDWVFLPILLVNNWICLNRLKKDYIINLSTENIEELHLCRTLVRVSDYNQSRISYTRCYYRDLRKNGYSIKVYKY